MHGRRAAVLAVGLLAAACRVDFTEPVPLRGPAPAAVLVWPAPAGADPRPWQGLDTALRARGYAVPALAVAQEALAAAGLGAAAAAADPAALRRGAELLGADAVLVLDVETFAAAGTPLQRADWALRWRLVRADSGAVAWEFAHRGSYLRPAAPDRAPPGRGDPERPPVELFAPAAAPHADAAALCASLHRHALDHLPAAP